MTGELAAQRDMLERELAGLEQLLVPDPNWQALLALDRESGDASHRSDEQAEFHPATSEEIEEQRYQLRTALSNNRIFCARERIIEAIDLIGDELERGNTLVHEVAQDALMPDSLSSQPPDQEAGPGPGTDHKAQLLSQDAQSLRSKINVKIRSTPDGRPVAGMDVNALPDDESGADDLTAIRGVDAGLAAQLSEIGVRRYRQIANWSVDDVVSVRAALGLGKTISRDNWIEQAALLVGTPDVNDTSRQSEAVPVEVPVASVERVEPREPSTPDNVTESDQIARVAQNILARVAPAPVDEKPAASQDPHADADIVQPVALTSIAAAAAARSLDVLDVTEKMVAEEPDAELETQQVPLGPPDALQDIRGVDDALALQLNEAGVTHFSQIAEWTASDVATLSISLALGTRITRECWVEQAAALLRDDDTAFSRHRKTGTPARAGAMIDWSICPAPSPQVETPIEPVAPPAIDQALSPWLVGSQEQDFEEDHEADEVEPVIAILPAVAAPQAKAADEIVQIDDRVTPSDDEEAEEIEPALVIPVADEPPGARADELTAHAVVPDAPVIEVEPEPDPVAEAAFEEPLESRDDGAPVPVIAVELDEKPEPHNADASTDTEVLIPAHPAVVPEFLVVPALTPAVLPASLEDNQAAKGDYQAVSESTEVEIVAPTAHEPLAADPPANENSPVILPARAVEEPSSLKDSETTAAEKLDQTDVSSVWEQDEAEVEIVGGRADLQTTSQDAPEHDVAANATDDELTSGEHSRRARRSHYSPTPDSGGGDDPDTDSYSSFHGQVDEASVSIISRAQKIDQATHTGGGEAPEEPKRSTVKGPALSVARKFLKTLRGR